VTISGVLIVPTVMVGLRADQNTVACQMSSPLSLARSTLGFSNYFDRCTYDSASMHVCPFIPGGPFTSMMGGINQSDGTYLCYNPAHYVPAILSGPACNPAASQSSDLIGLDSGAGNAVDGNTDGNFWDGSVTHTDNAGDVWWFADIGAGHTITGVNIYNRTDCCSERLANIDIQSWIPANGWTTFASYTASTLNVSSISLTFPTPFSQTLLIRKTDTNPLSLAEVQVMGW